jgi:hypothetical protein
LLLSQRVADSGCEESHFLMVAGSGGGASLLGAGVLITGRPKRPTPGISGRVLSGTGSRRGVPQLTVLAHLCARMGHSTLTCGFGRNRVQSNGRRAIGSAESHGMVIMFGTNRSWQAFVLMTVMGLAGAGWAQDAPETPPAPPQSEGSVTPAQDNSALATEVEQLRSEVDQLKQQVVNLSAIIEQLQGTRAAVEPAPPKKAASAKSSVAAKKKTSGSTASAASTAPIVAEGEDRAPLTVLVFHDGHKTEARNYAIVGQTLWIYTDQDSKKVPLADLDVNATKEANLDRGITFQMPTK